MTDKELLVRDDIQNSRPVSARIEIPPDTQLCLPRSPENPRLWLQCSEAGIRAIHSDCGKLIEYIDTARGAAHPKPADAGKETK